MIVCIDGILTPEEADALNRQLAEFSFEDGRASAGVDAQRVKNNLQVRIETEPRARPLIDAVVKALERQPLFVAATLAQRISLPTACASVRATRRK